MTKNNVIMKLAVPMIVIGMLTSCNGKSGSSSKKSSASDYPIVEIGEGLAKAALAYSQVYEFHDGYAQVRGGNSYGLIDNNGNVVLPCNYNSIELYGKVALVNRSLCGVVSLDGREIVPCNYREENIAVFPEEELIRIEKGSQEFHFIDYEGNDILPNGLRAIIGAGKNWNKDDLVTFSEGLAAACFHFTDPDYKYGFVDRNGREVFQLRFADPALFQGGYAWIGYALINEQGEKMVEIKDGSLVDKDGTVIIPANQFKSIGCIGADYDYGYLIVQGSNNRYGIWDIIHKKEVIPCTYDWICSDYDERYGWSSFVKDSIVLVTNDEQYGAVNLNGKEIVPCRYKYASIENGCVIVESINPGGYSLLHGLYDKDGNELLPSEYSDIKVYDDILVARSENRSMDWTYRLFRRDGKDEVLSVHNALVGTYSEGLIGIKDGDKFGFYDENGDEVIAPKYEEAGFFSEGLAPVKLNGKWGYVNHAGKDSFGEQK